MPKTTTRFENPPLNEVGLTVMFDRPTVYAPYNVANFHQLVRSEYPLAQQQSPLLGLSLFPTNGDDLNAPGGFELTEAPGLNRWWFMSADARRVLQIQENMLALNWRKFGGGSEAGEYPGFSALVNEFEDYADKVRTVERPPAFEFPQPEMCELLLDNLVPLEHEGQAFRMSEVLSMITPAASPRPLLAFQMGWFERMPGRLLEQQQDFSVNVAILGAKIGDEAESKLYARIFMLARREVSSWSEVSTFFKIAKAHATERFLELTTEAAQATW